MGGINLSPPQFMFINQSQYEGRQQPNVENMVNDLLRSFMDIFTGHEFLRMRTQYSDFSPNDFMQNFNQSFESDALFEIVRRMSEMEAQNSRKKKKAKTEAVKRLPIVKIEKKHCKKIGTKLEPPTCTVCCESINVDTKGMFMPCGHVYHPDCLTPWLESHNSCPVCRFELPLEEGTEN